MKPSSAFGCALLLALAAACGPKEPPKQASGPDVPDPGADPNAPSAGSSGSSGSGTASSGGAKRGGGDDIIAPPPSGKPATGKGGEPPQVSSLGSFMEGVRWGMSHAEVTKVFTDTGGVLWKDYDEKLAKARVGPEQNALEAERESAKGAFTRTYIEFGNTPTGFDTSGVRGEFSYRNKESLMWIQRAGKKRYFFFIGDRLWKIYDEIPLSDSGPMGKVYLDGVNKLNAQFNAQGRVKGPDPAKGVTSTTVDWKDSQSHLRVIDRSGDNVVGVVVEEGSTLANLDSLRPNKVPDNQALDPTILAVTKGTNRSDPNAPAGSASAGKKNPPPKKK